MHKIRQHCQHISEFKLLHKYLVDEFLSACITTRNICEIFLNCCLENSDLVVNFAWPFKFDKYLQRRQNLSVRPFTLHSALLMLWVRGQIFLLLLLAALPLRLG